MIVKLQPSRGTFSIYALLNSEVSAPISTKISHHVEALVRLLIRAFTKRCCILFRNARAVRPPYVARLIWRSQARQSDVKYPQDTTVDRGVSRLWSLLLRMVDAKIKKIALFPTQKRLKHLKRFNNYDGVDKPNPILAKVMPETVVEIILRRRIA